MAVVHTTTIVITSEGDNPEVSVELIWDPALDEFDPRKLGYTPACFKFVEKRILPVLERAYMEGTNPEIFEDSPSNKRH